MKGLVFNIQKFSIHDGPGIRTTVFFKGCNLQCKWCANPESQCGISQLTLDLKKCIRCGKCIDACPKSARSIDKNSGFPITDTGKCTHCLECKLACPEGAVGLEGKEYTVEEIVTEVLKDKAFYDTSGGGATLSGGEVLLQSDFAAKLCRRLHEEGVSVAIETAANVNTDVFSRFIREVDFVFMDLKHYDSEQHKAGTGVGNEQIIENMKHLSKSGIPYTVRIPVIPDFNDSKDDAHAFGTLFRNLNIKQVELLPFHQMGELKYANLGKKYTLSGIPGLHPEDLKPFAKILETYIDHVQIGG